jgi:hypothetical protein
MSLIVAADPVPMGTSRSMDMVMAGCLWVKTVLRRSRLDPFLGVDDRLLADMGLLRCAAFE